MKKFQFSLDSVLRYHQQRERQAELDLREASLVRLACITEVRTIEEEMDLTCHLGETIGGKIDPQARTSSVVRLSWLGETLKGAKEKLKVAEQRFREAEKACRELAQKVESFSHLRTERKTEYLAEVARQHQIEVDEFVIQKWKREENSLSEH